MKTRSVYQARTRVPSPPRAVSKTTKNQKSAKATEKNAKITSQTNPAKTRPVDKVNLKAKSSLGTRSPLVRPSASTASKRMSQSTTSTAKKSITQSVKDNVTPSIPSNDETVSNLRQLNNTLLEKIKQLENELSMSRSLFEELKTSTQNIPETLSRFVQNSLDILSDSTFAGDAPEIVNQIDAPSFLLDVSDTDVTSQLNPPLSPVPVPVHHTKPQLLIIGDSMGRDFAEILKPLLPDYTVSAQIYPGCTLETILSEATDLTLSLTKRDLVFIIAGVNNIPNLCPTLLDKLLEQYKLIFKETNFIFSNVPNVHHKPHLNGNIFATNLCLLKHSSVFEYHMFNCNLFLARSMYTKHGLHFNMFGKKEFCRNLAESVLHFQASSYAPSVLLNQGIFL
uniref:Uncharacterized protein n=1 Tax=Cacopsylla melanoneura TaxID=428564 RepID=A0A8D9F813_9HEMI